MSILVVVRNPKNWPLHIPDVEVVSSTAYLTDPRYAEIKGAKVFNLCRSYSYQKNGYYVSLLAAARGQKPIPDITALQDMRSGTISRIMSEDLETLIQQNLYDIQGKEHTLSIYFGKNIAKRYDRLAGKLHNLFEAPLLRAFFVFKKEWQLKRIVPISMSEVPDRHRAFVIAQAQAYFSKKHIRAPKKTVFSYDLAILYDAQDKCKPSNPRAIRRFMRAAIAEGMRPEIITKDDYGRIAEFDALFIRTTTGVNHFTYQFARRAEAEGLAVIDDTESIIRCSNKVFLAETLRRLKVPIPKTFIIHEDQIESYKDKITFPCVLKEPDSSFSKGVIKIENWDELIRQAHVCFENSDLILIQEFISTGFDWRVGVLDGAALFACKYHMARQHWQIVKKASTGKMIYGKVETLAVKKTPPHVLEAALQAARSMGNGFYGVDLKEVDGKAYVIEVNDNPNLDAGFEDRILKNRLYRKIMKSLKKRIEWVKDGKAF